MNATTADSYRLSANVRCAQYYTFRCTPILNQMTIKRDMEGWIVGDKTKPAVWISRVGLKTLNTFHFY